MKNKKRTVRRVASKGSNIGLQILKEILCERVIDSFCTTSKCRNRSMDENL